MSYWLDEPPPDPLEATPSPEDYVAAEDDDDTEPPHGTSTTATAAEALRSGVFPPPERAAEIPGEDEVLRTGDPDVDPLENELVGDEMPGASMPTPDQDDVDEIGRAYGITDEDSRELVLGDTPIEERDRRRWELNVRSKERR